MQLVSINIATARQLRVGERSVRTGIFKEPVASARVIAGGLVDDAVCDARHHGGLDQAVYVYSNEDYDWFRRELGCNFAPGVFGENLTVSGVLSADVAAGDRFVFGEVLIEAAAPRIPCNILGARVGDAGFPQAFRRAERPGCYCRVVREGALRVGETAALRAFEGERVTMRELFRATYDATPSADDLRRHLRAPISVRERERKQRQLAAADPSAAT